jgi:hypothetical protein
MGHSFCDPTTYIDEYIIHAYSQTSKFIISIKSAPRGMNNKGTIISEYIWIFSFYKNLIFFSEEMETQIEIAPHRCLSILAKVYRSQKGYAVVNFIHLAWFVRYKIKSRNKYKAPKLHVDNERGERKGVECISMWTHGTFPQWVYLLLNISKGTLAFAAGYLWNILSRDKEERSLNSAGACR